MLKKVIAALTASLLAVSVAGCGSSKDKSWVAQLGDEKISSGVYVLNLMSAQNYASMIAPAGTEDLLTADIEGKKGSAYIQDYALNETKRQMAIHNKFVELGLTHSDEDKALYEKYGKDMYSYDSEVFAAAGITEQDAIDVNKYSLETFRVFEALYAGEGEYAASEDEKLKYFADNYYLAYVVPFVKLAEDYSPLEGDALQQVIDDSNRAYEDIKNGKDIIDVIHEVAYSKVTGSEVPERGEDSEYMMVVDKQNSGMYPEVLSNHLAQAKVGDLALIEDETFRIIVKKLDETNPDKEIATYYYDQMLPQLKQADYMALTEEWVKGLEIKLNDSAIKHYTPEKLKKDTDAFFAAQSSSAASSTSSVESDASSSSSDTSSSESAGSSAESSSAASSNP